MSLQLASPPDAVRALVTVWLVGDVRSREESAVAQGAAVTLDDVSLVQQ